MPSRLDKLLTASFRGIQFLVTSESLSDAGRKIVLHEYPDSSTRFVEDLGQIPSRFKVQAFVSGDDWLDRASALETELNKKGPGILVMPTMGSISIYALPYTKDASQSSIGIISYTLDFAVGQPANAPTAAPTTSQEVFDKGDAARVVIEEKFGSKFKTPGFVKSAQTAIGDIRDSVSEVVKNINDKIDVKNLQKLVAKAKRIAVRAPQLLSDPTALAFELIGGSPPDPGISQLMSLGFGISGAVSSLQVLADYGDSLLTSETSDTVTGSSVVSNDEDETSNTTPYWDKTTAEREDRNDRRRLIVRNQRLNAMIVMYEQLAVGEYNTTDDITTSLTIVEDQYKKIMLDGTGDVDSFQADQDIRFAVDDLRSSSLALLSDREQQIFGLVGIDQKAPTSKFVLAYNLYAEEFTDSELLTDRSIVIGNLNPNQNSIAMAGDLSVLQNRVVS